VGLPSGEIVFVATSNCTMGTLLIEAGVANVIVVCGNAKLGVCDNKLTDVVCVGLYEILVGACIGCPVIV
jgi:hypothetical protein